MKQFNKLFTIGVLTSLLLGCYNKGELKTMIQSTFDKARANTQAKGDFCYYLGSVKFPYTDEPILETDIQWVIWNKEKLSRSLPLFAEIGLLTQEPVAGKSGIYHYDLTELGREYQHEFPKRSGSGRIIYNNAFCYGIIQLDQVTDVKEYTPTQGYGNASPGKQTLVDVDYDYHVLEIPDWVTNSQDELNRLYSQMKVRIEGKSHLGSVTFVKKKDGSLYQDSLSYFLIKPTGDK